MKKSTPSHKNTDTLLTVISGRLDVVAEKIGSMDRTLAKQEINLEEHMRRTVALEEQLEPVKRHVAMFEGALKLVGGLAVVAGLAVSIMHIMGII